MPVSRKKLTNYHSNITDTEFGNIKLLRNSGRYLRLNVRTNGQIVLSAPLMTSNRTIQRFLDSSRDGLRASLTRINNKVVHKDGEKIGQRHVLRLKNGVRPAISVTTTTTYVSIPSDYNDVRRELLISKAISKTLKQEAERYLPKRLRYFADKFSFSYDRVRLTFAKTRWGSCSSSGTISLNIALMTLSPELIDYVIMHELVHTHHMNHSQAFWQELEDKLPGAETLKVRLKKFSPYI